MPLNLFPDSFSHLILLLLIVVGVCVFERGNVERSNVVILELLHSHITHTQKRIALRYGTFHKINEIQPNFMEVVCDNTGN